MSIIWLWFGFILIMFGLMVNLYILLIIYTKIETFIKVHVYLNPDVADNNTFIPIKSIEEILLNLSLINFISFIVVTILIIQARLKFNFNKNINNIYIWLSILILILGLAFAAHIYMVICILT